MEAGRDHGRTLQRAATSTADPTGAADSAGAGAALGLRVQSSASGIAAVSLPAVVPGAHVACGFQRLVRDFFAGLLDEHDIERADEHLAECGRCQELISRHVEPAMEPAEPWVAGAPQTFSPGELVGRRYRVLRSLGRGGMGEVYHAFDTLLREEIALKTLLATDCDSAEGLSRLLGEARIARRVFHPNVCRTYDAGLHESERRSKERFAFVTMELILGETLRRSIRGSGPLHTTQLQRIGGEVLAGLMALHAEGIVHRDVKCTNIILCGAPSWARRTVLVDLGLAVDCASQWRGTPSGTSRVVEGTLAYMAPEQLVGLPVTPATDVYGFGVTLFEMVTGCCPFAELPPGTREYPNAFASSALSASPYHSPALERFLRRCLVPEPSSRFADAACAKHAFSALW